MNESIASLIARRERQILVHSYLYYEMDESIIEDYTWSMWAKELYELNQAHPEEFESSPYYKQFQDFDPSTGFNIYKGVEWWALGVSRRLLDYRDKNENKS